MSGPLSSTHGSTLTEHQQIALTLLEGAAEYAQVVNDLLTILTAMQKDSCLASTSSTGEDPCTVSPSTHDDLGDRRSEPDDCSGRLF